MWVCKHKLQPEREDGWGRGSLWLKAVPAFLSAKMMSKKGREDSQNYASHLDFTTHPSALRPNLDPGGKFGRNVSGDRTSAMREAVVDGLRTN